MTDAPGLSRILTLVFTDLVDSTALKRQQGDQAVGELIARHRALVERLAVDLAARISGLAGRAQVLMSSGVADTARRRLDASAFSQPILWRAYGPYSLKGFDEPLEIREAPRGGSLPCALATR